MTRRRRYDIDAEVEARLHETDCAPTESDVEAATARAEWEYEQRVYGEGRWSA